MGAGKRPQPQVAKVIRLRPDLSQAQAVQMDETLMIKPFAQKEIERVERKSVQAVQTLGDILDTELGPLAEGRYDQEVSKIALEVIHSGPILQLALKDWTHVQALIEAGIRAGVAAEQTGRL